jgi:hypothetical protein
MDARFYWLLRVGETFELATLLVGMPALSFALSFAAWRGRSEFFASGRYRVAGVLSFVAIVLLLVIARSMMLVIAQSTNSYETVALWLLQESSFVLALLLFGVVMGCGFCEFLRMWRWHRRTSLRK